MTTRRQWHAKGLKRPPPGPMAPLRVIAIDRERRVITWGYVERPWWIPQDPIARIGSADLK